MRAATRTVSELREWLDPTVTCRRGHRLQVPFGDDVQRLLDATPRGAKVYLPTAPEPKPIRLRLEPVPRR
jgi:hypothetical protein